MALSTIIQRWQDAQRTADSGAKKAACNRLVTELWTNYRPMLYALARRHCPGQQSDILASGFRKFVRQLDDGKIPVTTREELFGLLKKRIIDKISEHARKDRRRRDIVPMLTENELIGKDNAGGQDDDGAADGIAAWATSRKAPPEFQAVINDLVEAVQPGRLRDVLLLIIEDPERSNADIARILLVSDREVGRRRARIAEELARKCE